MKKLLSFRKLVLLLLTLLTTSCASQQASSANRTSDTNQVPQQATSSPQTEGEETPQPLESPETNSTPQEPNPSPPRPSGRTPQELGDEYPKLVRQAREAVSQLQQNMQIKFPLGVNYPILIGNSSTPSDKSKYEVIGSVDSSGKPTPIAPADLVEMFDYHLNQLGQGNVSSSTIPQLVLVADTKGTYLQSQKVSVLDLIVIDRQTQQIYLVPNVAFIAILRDALNAALNKEITPNNYNVTQLNLRGEVEQLPR